VIDQLTTHDDGKAMMAEKTRIDACRGRGVTARRSFFAAVVAACGMALPPSSGFAQTADRVMTTEGTFSGKVVSATADVVELEERSGDTRKVAIDKLREVQFGGEPQSLRAARSLLGRGRAADALEEIAKVEASEIDGAEQLVLDEMDFVKAAASGRVALATAADPAAPGKLVNDFLTKHPRSHHSYEMQELLGDLLARAGKADAANAAYSQVAKGPPAFKVRAAAAKAGMLFDQKKFDEAIAEYDSAVKIDANDDSSAAQKRSAELGKARCLSQLGRNDDAVKLVMGIVKQADPEERDMLARAFNVLGGAYRAAGDKDQDALISYLTVDLVYNGNSDSHAEALYNLSELWERAKNPERSREARKTLEDSYPRSRWAKKPAAQGNS